MANHGNRLEMAQTNGNPVFGLIGQAEAGPVMGGIDRPAEKSTVPVATMGGLLAGTRADEKP
jgi:hypothetical protein